MDFNQIVRMVSTQAENAYNRLQNHIQEHVLTPTFQHNVHTTYRWLSDDFGTVWGGTSGLFKGMQGLTLISDTNTVVKALGSVASLVMTVTGVASSLENIARICRLRDETLQGIQAPNRANPRDMRVQDLTASCHYVIGHVDDLHGTLKFAKDTHIDQKAQRILANLRSDDEQVQTGALLEGEKLMYELRHRVNMKLGIETAKLAVRTAAVAVSLTSFWLPTPHVLIASGIIGVATLTLYIFEKVMLPKDPFSEPNDVWYETVPYNIRHKVYDVTDRLSSQVVDTTNGIITLARSWF